ncbi:hypothetical protein LEN26_014823 [Aphanomyces euteiches]|nr:hypothetical protein LEN26_014823 [Aphanomyces euteiches]KAH9186089.1 hypothetical protein AeNC1_011940 [Aphanomyces euteiches]
MDDGMTRRDHQSTQLNAHATEFIPAKHKAFLNEYPSLSSKQTPLPRPRRKLDSPLNFQAVASKTPSHPLTAPQPTPALPQGFVALSKPKSEPEADTKPPDKPVIEKPVTPIPKPTKRKHTTKPLTQWCAPPRPASSSPTLEAPTIVETAVEINAQGRSPGYFFHLAAQSKVQGQNSASYHEAGQWLPEKVARPPPPPPVLPLDVDAPPSSVESIRTEWQTLLQQHISQPTLDRVDLDAIKAFLRLHRSLLLWDERDDERRNAWHLAATFGHDEVLEFLATLGEGVDARDRKKQTPLHLAAAHGRASSVRLLLSLSANASVVDKNGNTPFHLSCRHGHLACVKILLHKTKLDVRNKQRNTPLGLAVSAAVSSPPPNDALAVVHLLLASGASALSVNHNGETPLYMALESVTSTNVFELLLVYGYPLSSKTIRSVFLRAVALGHLAALELLLPILPPQEWTAVDPDTGDTALHVCIRHAPECIPLLCSKQSKLLAMENAQLLTPLFLAIHLDDAVALKTLLTRGGYPNERNRRNQSALFAALVKSKSACVRVLVEFGCALDADCIAYVQQTTRVDAGSPPTKRQRWTRPDLLLESVDGVQLSMHKCILVARCAVFRAQLCGLWSSSQTTTSRISIDCTAATFNRLADYLYTGTLQLDAAAVALDDLVELLVAANAWLLFDLQHLCIAALRNQLDPFELADVVGQLGIADVPTTRLAQRATKQWRQDMLDLMTEGWFADVTLVSTDHVTRNCHRAVLASVSAVLETMVESADSVSFPYTSAVLHLLLDYIYADVIDLEKMPRDLIQDVLVASAAYHIWPCVFACESFLVDNIAALADADLLAFAQTHATVVPRLLAACRLRLLEMVAHDPAILLACLT